MKYICFILMLGLSVNIYASSLQFPPKSNYNIISNTLLREPVKIIQIPVVSIAEGIPKLQQINVLLDVGNMMVREVPIDFRNYRCYVDGVKIIGDLNIPKSSISYLEVFNFGIPAEFGDFSFGRIGVFKDIYPLN